MNERSEKREKKDDGTRSASSGGNGSASAGTVLRTPGRETAVTAKKSEPASDAVQADGQQVWSAKSLPVWQPGDLISGVYKVEEVRAGGMGRVYMCRHEKWRVKVALKSPNEMMLSDKALFARILREAEAWTELGMHPNIAYCYFVHTIDEVPHIVVEYVDGGSLEEWIQEGKCIDYRTNLDLAIQFCHAMEHAHLKGMIHRDIKPQNVLMTRDGTLKVTDFGLVSGGKPVEADLQRTSSDPGNAGLTAIGTFMGTPGYMAPEQAVDAGSVDARADIFSFGVCLYEMFCGNKPYQTTLGDPETPGDPKTLSHDPDFPPALTPVLLKCVQWDHEARYSRFQEIRVELNAIHRKLFGADSAYAEVNLVGLDADGMNNRGVSFYELGRESEAEASFRAALEADALHPQATYNLGLLEWRSGSIADDEVVRRMETRLKDAGTSKNILNSLLAQIHMERMHPDDAQTVLRDHPGQFDNLFSNSPPAGIKLRAVMEGHQSGVKAVRFKDGNRYVISVDGRAALRRWDCRTGEALSSSQLYSDTISAVSLDADAERILFCDADNTLHLLNLQSGSFEAALKGHTDTVWSSCISPDGATALSGSSDKTIRYWDLASGRCLSILEGHTSGVCAVCISPDGLRALSGGSDQMIRYWDLDGGGCLATLAGHTNEVGSVCISPDGRRGLSGSWDKSILYWDLETGRCLRKLKGHSRLVYSICFSPDGRRALSGGGNTARLWDLESGRCLSTLAGYYSTVLSVCFSPDGRLAMSGCNDKANRLWEIVDGNRFQQPLAISKPKGHRELTRKEVDCQLRLKEIDELIETKRHEKAWHRLKRLWMEEHLISDRQGLERYPLLCANGKTIGLVSVREHCILAGHDGEVLCVDISPCGSQAVSGSKDKTLRLWDLQTGSCKATFQEHADTVDTVCFSPDGLHVLSGSADKTLRFYDLEAGSCQAVLKGHENFVKSAAISHDGRYAISASFDKTLRLWDLETARCRLVLTGHTSAVSSVRLSRDGRHAISGGFDKTLRYWDLANGVCLATMNTPSLVFSVSMHPNGRQAMSLDYRGNLSSWDISSGKCLATIDVQNGDSNVLSISPDGRHVITGGWPKPLCVWDMESRQCISNLKAHHNAVNSVCFSPDGNSIYTASADKTIKGWQVVWELDFPSPVDWDETVRPYLHAFLNLRRGRWSEPDFELLLKELAEQRGLGWVRAEGIRTELQKMTAAWQDAGDRNTASAQLEAELSDRTPGEDAHQGNVTNDSQDKTPNTIAEEEEMTQPMVQPESVSLASIKDLFERAFFTVADHDTFLVVQEQGRNVNYLLQLPNNNCLRLQVVFQTREPRPGSRLELVNRINQEMLALRACFAEPHIILDWYIPLDGGITETNIVKSFKFFQLLCNNALQFDTEGVFS